MLTALSADMHADDFRYLVFESAEGTQKAMTVDGLTMVCEDGCLKATNADGRQSFDLASLGRMFFSNASTGIDNARNILAGQPLKVYTAAGVYCGTFTREQLAGGVIEPGAYIVKSGAEVKKVILRKQ